MNKNFLPGQLLQKFFHQIFWKRPLFSNKLTQIAAATKFHHQINIILVPTKIF